MRVVLKPIYHRFHGGEVASQDYFDHRGTLLLGKGQEITPSLASYFNEQSVNSLHYEWPESSSSNEEGVAPALANISETAPWLQRIYLDTHLFKPQVLYQAVNFTHHVLEYLVDNPDIASDLHQLRTTDLTTYYHSLHVALLSYAIGKTLNLNGEKMCHLVLGALLHDIGKLEISSEVLNKPRALTPEEFALVQTHAEHGVTRSSKLVLPESVLTSILQHHERWNGSGYPQGLSEQSILLPAQIMAVADVFDALISDRPYHTGLPPYHALEILCKGSGTDFSPGVIQALLRTVQLYPADSLVTLNTGESGVVHQFSYPNLTQPKIQILFDAFGKAIDKEWIIDLAKDSSRFILTMQHSRVG